MIARTEDGLTRRRGDHLVDRGHDHLEQDHKLGVVLGPDTQPSNLGQALERHVSELGHLEELQNERRGDASDHLANPGHGWTGQGRLH